MEPGSHRSDQPRRDRALVGFIVAAGVSLLPSMLIALAIALNGQRDDRLLQFLFWFMGPVQLVWLGLLLLYCAVARLWRMALGVVIWCAVLVLLFRTEFWSKWWGSLGS